MSLKSRLPFIAATLPKRVDAAMGQAMDVVVARAKERVPVGQNEPHLRDHIHKAPVPDTPSRFAKEQPHGGWYVVGGDDEAFYGHFVEWGTSHSSPQPFLVPALEESKTEIQGIMQASLRNL